MRVSLNLSTAPQENRRPFIAAAVLIGLVAIVSLVFLSRAAYVSWQSNRLVRSQIAVAQARIQETTAQQARLAAYFKTPQAREITDRADFLNSLIDERSFPWTRIFESLEETLPDGVRVVSIAPRLVNGRAEVAISVGAVNDEQKIKFEEAIEKSKAFSNLEIVSERRDAKADSLDQILLQLKVVYEIT
jgi:Tfp pilus assembly protein PilN